MRDVQLAFSPEIREHLRATIAGAGGNEVFFLGRVSWSNERGAAVATVEEVEVFARGNRTSVPAILHRAEGWDISIHNHPSGELEPSEADQSIAHELSHRSVGFAIISNDATRHYLVVPPPQQRLEVVRIDPEEVRAIFSAQGPISAVLGDYEAREGQVEMAMEVARALNEDRVLAAEAGTGIGKSFAYLVPSILWAVRNKQRVVISTGTIHLQEQLVLKDLPFLAKALPVSFTFALIKGRNNYACLRKAGELAEELSIDELLPRDERKQLESLVEWIQTTKEGSRSDLAWIPPLHAWEQVMSETDKSLKVSCKHYSDCFYYRAKREATSANILVVNHHLFFADLSARRETENYEHDLVLPPYRRVIFDEAHHLEDVASEYFGVRFSRASIEARLGRLLSSKDHKRGAIPVLVRRLRGLGDPVAADAIERVYVGTLIEARERVDDVFHAIEELLRGLPHEAARDRRSGSSSRFTSAADGGAPAPGSHDGTETPELQLRYRGDPAAESFWGSLSDRLADLEEELGRLLAVNDRALNSLEHSRLTEEQIQSQSLELTAFGNRLKGLLVQIGRFRDFGEPEQARWIASREARWKNAGPAIELASAPIRVSEVMKAAVYDPMKTVVLTSATLSVAGRADFLADRLGLSSVGPERFEFKEHGSPFDYATQALTVIPTDFPLPESPAFERSIPEAVHDIVEAAGGRAFVLFTSYALLRRTYAAVAGRLTAIGLRPMAQGEAGRSELLERFRNGVGNVLFGTDSFWEGVDVKGKALGCVIITRLPFRVPSEPIQEARMEDLESRGENPFTSFTVPQAVLKLKQGFGRLIRSRTDRGVVAVLDRRILTKPYGRVFLASLPQARLLKAPLAESVLAVKRFFAGSEGPPDEADPFPLSSSDGDSGPPW